MYVDIWIYGRYMDIQMIYVDIWITMCIDKLRLLNTSLLEWIKHRNDLYKVWNEWVVNGVKRHTHKMICAENALPPSMCIASDCRTYMVCPMCDRLYLRFITTGCIMARPRARSTGWCERSSIECPSGHAEIQDAHGRREYFYSFASRDFSEILFRKYDFIFFFGFTVYRLGSNIK